MKFSIACSYGGRALRCKNFLLDEDVWLFAAFSHSVDAHLRSLNSPSHCLLTSNICLRETKKYFIYRYQIVENIDSVSDVHFLDIDNNSSATFCAVRWQEPNNKRRSLQDCSLCIQSVY
uniref:Uncharacterized protein n=1 Tax=Parascaris univalens TaxID=6257 RepID=A0A915CIF7_PARUN